MRGQPLLRLVDHVVVGHWRPGLSQAGAGGAAGLERGAMQRDARVAAAHAGRPAVGDEQRKVSRAGAWVRAGPLEGMWSAIVLMPMLLKTQERRLIFSNGKIDEHTLPGAAAAGLGLATRVGERGQGVVSLPAATVGAARCDRRGP